MIYKQILVTSAILTFPAWCIGRDTHYVAHSGSNVPPYTTWGTAAKAIQPAINAATTGDTVLVGAGTYVLSSQIELTKGITLRSASGANVTIIDGNRPAINIRCLYIENPLAMVDGFTIRKGHASADSGGGVKIYGGGILKNCIVKNNIADLSGGGIFCQYGGTVENCKVLNNKCAACGGGIMCYNGGFVQDSQVISNSATAGWGGGLALDGLPARARNCQIKWNTAKWSGGGAYLEGDTVLEETRLENNSAPIGGGVYGRDWGTIRKCFLALNRATNTLASGSGGGASINGYFYMKNCGVFLNYSDDRAGGVAMTGRTMLISSVVAGNFADNCAGGVSSAGESDIDNCTIIQNQVLDFFGSGGGLYCNSSGMVENTIIFSNTATFFPNCYDDGIGGYYRHCCTKPLPANGFGNITKDPKFNHTDKNLSWTLSANSPCIDTGWFILMSVTASDYMARPRVLNNMLDIGAIEFGRVLNDYNTKGRSALTVYSQTATDMSWFATDVAGGAASLWNVKWGFSGCVPVPGDYNEDGRPDLAVFHPASGKWYIRTVSGLALAMGKAWGFNGCIPVPGDYDQDWRDDLALYDHANCKWYISGLDGEVIAWKTDWGFSGCTPVPGDYDGDGCADLAVFHSASGRWYIRTVSSCNILGAGLSWGFSGCIPVPGDYDCDGRSDLAVFQPSTGDWYIRDMTGNVLLWKFNWGFNGCTPIIADFNGGGISELAVYHKPSGKWYITQPQNGTILAWGKSWGGSSMPAVKQ